MANMASVAYATEGPEEILQKINEAIVVAVNSDDKRYEMYQAAEYLKLPIKNDTRLGGEISEEPTWDEKTGALRFWSEERWGLQDFAELLEKHFPDIKVYWVVEECGMEIYCTNDKEGKYFPERYLVDTCIDGIYNSEYFRTEEEIYKWLDKLTHGRVKCKEDVEEFNADYEDSGTDDKNFIYIHEFEIEE
jgi:hypothetical protein